MAPDADKLRQRKAIAIETNGDEIVATNQGQDVLRTMDNLKSTEVCIDGDVYDIADFDHPGGETIFVFGGNDVTETYKMIHAHHTEKQLEKMKRVGKVVDYSTE